MIKKIKKWLAGIVTALIIVTLFGIIFVATDIVQPSPTFFLELSAVMALILMMKIFWYDYAEDKRLSEDDIKREKDNYYSICDKNIEDSNDLDKFLVILNKENRDFYINNKMGSRKEKDLAVKNKWICFWHPSYKKLTAEEIGVVRYNKLLFKYMRKADKLNQIKSAEIMALTDSAVLYDSKNHLKQKKRTYQITTTAVSFAFATLLAFIGLKEIMLNWANLFRFVFYLASIVFTIATTIISAYKTTGIETFDYFDRLKFIIDKYVTYKKKEVQNATKISNSVELGGLFEKTQ